MLVHDGWAMGRILTVEGTTVVSKYDEGKGKGPKNKDGTYKNDAEKDIKTDLRIRDYDGYIFGDNAEPIKATLNGPEHSDIHSKTLFNFTFGDNTVQLEGRRVNQMIDFIQISDSQQGLDVKFIHKFQTFMESDTGLRFLDNVHKNNLFGENLPIVRNKDEKKAYIKQLMSHRTKPSQYPVTKCNWPFTPQCYYYPKWRTEENPHQITVSTTLIVHKSLPKLPELPIANSGGAPRRRAVAKRTANKNKKSAKKTTAAAPASGSPWQSTGRKVTAKDGRKKLVYRNAATGELRVRRVSVNERTGKRVTRYVKA